MELKNYEIIGELAEFACRGDKNAEGFCLDVWRLTQYLDDVYDKDELSDEEVDDLITTTFTGFIGNPFAIAYANTLAPFFTMAIANWRTANKFESEKNNIEKAYVLRAQVYNVFVVCAGILGGQAWADEVSKVVWSSYGEKLKDLEEETKNA